MPIIEIIDPAGQYVNAIVASEAFAQAHYPGAWRLAAAQNDPAAAPAARKLSVLAFRRRFTLAERAAIEWAAVDRADRPEAERQQAAMLRAVLADQTAASFIDLDDDATAQGVQALVAAGLLTLARASAILGTPVQPGELP